MTFIERNPQLRSLVANNPIDFAPARACVASIYNKLAEELPTDHVWRGEKLEHVAHVERVLRDNAPMLGLNEQETEVLGFLMFAHDVGRMVEALRTVSGKPRAPWLHGVDSVQVTMDAFAENGIPHYGSLWDALFVAIELHSDPRMLVELKHLHSVAITLTGVLRDFDKRAGFEDAARYTSDPDFKVRQAKANWPEQREADPLWGTERRAILPASMINVFVAWQTLIREDCQSYEAYMLQLLAWVFDVANPEILALIVNEGGPGVVLKYLEAQLPPEEYRPIEQTYKEFLKNKGL